ncbi:acyl carrier protein [Streptomyces sp. TG1A-60]|uniref:acyl carrier protein n=1 Tax=Streptomyces sp. TG1A-60 TaxID=3129111 RepID=UPI0030CC6513
MRRHERGSLRAVRHHHRHRPGTAGRPQDLPGVPEDLGDDAELVLDSLGLVWLLHVVEERYGLVVEPGDEDIARLTSLRRLTEFLSAAGADPVEGGGRGDR